MRESKGYLALVDISGYTEFVRSHKMGLIPILGQRMKTTSEVHAETVITDLLETIISTVDSRLTLNKLEGDAALFYRESRGDPDECDSVLTSLVNVFSAFNQRLEDIMFCQTCLCDCCHQMNQLKVKILVHYGDFLIKRVAQFEEIAGHDVILIHRLLKNSVPSNEYLLITEPVKDLSLEVTSALKFNPMLETYDVGDVPVHVYYPTPIVEPQPKRSWLSRYLSMTAFFKTPRRKAELALRLLSEGHRSD